MKARRYGLAQVLAIQDEINKLAREQGRPCVDLIDEEEHQRILELIEANTWPDRWNGKQVTGDVILPQISVHGTQHLLYGGGDVA